MLSCALTCLHGKAKSEGYLKQRIKFQKESYKELVESAIPIFIAAGMVSCTQTIIYIISEETKVKIGLNMLYVFLIYCTGKAITYHVSVDEHYHYSWSIFQFIRTYRLPQIIRSTAAEHVGFALKKLMVLLALEIVYLEFDWISAFAVWVALVVAAVLVLLTSEFLQRELFKIAEEFNLELVMFDAEAFPLPTAFLLTDLLAVGLFNVGVKYVSDNSYLFEWDKESDYEPHERSQNSYFILYCLLTSFLVSYLQARGYVASGEHFVEQPVEEGTQPRLSLPSAGRPSTASRLSLPMSLRSSQSNSVRDSESGDMYQVSLDPGSSRGDERVSTESFNEKVQRTGLIYNLLCCLSYELPFQCRQGLLELWDNCWGYFAGVAWFVLVLDNFKATRVAERSQAAADFVVVTFSAFITTIFCINLLTSIKMRQLMTDKMHQETVKKWNLDEKTRATLVSVRQSQIADPRESILNSKSNNSSNQSAKKLNDSLVAPPTGVSGVAKTAETVEKKKGKRRSKKDEEPQVTEADRIVPRRLFLYYYFIDYLIVIQQKQRDVMKLSFRLAVGWLWEVAVEAVFELTGVESLKHKGVVVLVEVGITSLLLLAAFYLHVTCQDWDDEEPATEGQGEQESSRKVDVWKENHQKSTSTEQFTDNPLLRKSSNRSQSFNRRSLLSGGPHSTGASRPSEDSVGRSSLIDKVTRASLVDAANSKLEPLVPAGTMMGSVEPKDDL